MPQLEANALSRAQAEVVTARHNLLDTRIPIEKGPDPFQPRAQAEVVTARYNLLDTRILITRLIGE